MASSFQYWRILFNGPEVGGSGDDNHLAIADWSFQDASGADISRTGGTASASTFLNSSWVPANAFDADTVNTAWLISPPSSASPQWLQYAFAAPVSVKTIKLIGRGGVGSFNPQLPAFFLIQGSSDGSSWTTIQTYSGLTASDYPSNQGTFLADSTVGNVRATSVVREVLVNKGAVRASQLAIEILVPNINLNIQPIIFIIT